MHDIEYVMCEYLLTAFVVVIGCVLLWGAWSRYRERLDRLVRAMQHPNETLQRLMIVHSQLDRTGGDVYGKDPSPREEEMLVRALEKQRQGLQHLTDILKYGTGGVLFYEIVPSMKLFYNYIDWGLLQEGHARYGHHQKEDGRHEHAS